mmetsp:Transcript_21889/g.19431  ORF Transcript_21889/g.19431 Transcript_21889/m.19431 type:complete len:193 (+) Transcript_21889:41-619(+)
MLIGWLIPSYVLYWNVYGWWVYCKIIFDEDELFEHSDLLMYFWLMFSIYLHVVTIRTLTSRYGYSKTTFTHNNKVIQGGIYLFALPLVFLDWECARNFSFFLAVTWRKFWFLIFIVEAAAVGSVWSVILLHMDYNDYWHYIGWIGFSSSFTILALVKFAWLLRLYVWLFYLVPLILYWVLYILMWPFLKCCS